MAVWRWLATGEYVGFGEIGVRVESNEKQFRQLVTMQKFLQRLPARLRGGIARDNAIRVFGLKEKIGNHP